MCHFHRLWNGMFDCYWAEITVMQFTGHSLLVHQSVTAQWDFYLVPNCQPSCILHSAQTLTPLITLYGAFKKTKQMQLPIQILVRLRLLLRRNGIKCLKNLFWMSANRFKDSLIKGFEKLCTYWVNLLFCVYLLILSLSATEWRKRSDC